MLLRHLLIVEEALVQFVCASKLIILRNFKNMLNQSNWTSLKCVIVYPTSLWQIRVYLQRKVRF